jgi:dipeptidyl aminopeptidase/acylaminoacyl peptidase
MPLAALVGAAATQSPTTSQDKQPPHPSVDTSVQGNARPATVADSIEMTQIGVANTLSGIPVSFSPDRKKFVVITHRGNLERNANDYSLRVFNSSDAFRSPKSQVLLTLSSQSNSPAISNVRWVNDRTILFLANMPGQSQQICSFDPLTRKMTRITQHSTDILAFDATSDTRLIAYLARPPVAKLFDQASRASGLVVSDQRMADLIIGHTPDDASLFLSPPQLFLKRDGQTDTRVIFHNREVLYPWFGVSISPDGQRAVVLSDTALYGGPEHWKEYETSQQDSFISYLVVDAETGVASRLIDAPAYSGNIVWLDGKSAIVDATYLPLNVDDRSERELRRSNTWTVEVDIANGAIRKVAQGNYLTMRLDAKKSIVFLKPLNEATAGLDRLDDQSFAYRKDGGNWERLDANVTRAASFSSEFEVQEEQNINTPPQLVAVSLKDRHRSVLMDLNPQFRNIRFGHVEDVSWTGGDETYTGGLYLPPDYIKGRRYPVVVQTHGWSQRFDIDGMSTAGFAAQPLAGSGFVVAQVPTAKGDSTPREGPQNMEMFETLIDELDRRGLIDRGRVGLLGHSRTGYAVWYMLAFSQYPIAAAAVIEGSDMGYFEYAAELNQSADMRGMYEGQNGAPAFGEGLQKWLSKAPGFNLDKIHTPVRQLGAGPYSIVYNWESYVGLKRLNKPVELILLPDAVHHPVKPLERITAQQGDVDWFRFWLQGYEDHDHTKSAQYRRWEHLCDMQRTEKHGRPTFCVGTRH